MKKVLVFYNPKAGIISREKKKRRVHEALQSLGFEPYFILVQDYFYRQTQPQELDYDMIVAAGGDGTIRLAANYLLGRNLACPLGVIPMGSGNLVAEAMGIPVRFKRAVQNLKKGKPTPIDMGLLNEEHYFILSFSMGHMAETVIKTPIKEKRRWGFWAYLKSFILRRIKIWDFEFEIDGKISQVSGNNLFIFNAIRLFGFTPKYSCDFQDGVFELFITRNRTFFGWIVAIYYMIVYHQPRHLVYNNSGKHFIIRPLRPGMINAQIDGDGINIDRAEIRVVPKKLNIILTA